MPVPGQPFLSPQRLWGGYFINLDTFTARRARMEEELARFGLADRVGQFPA